MQADWKVYACGSNLYQQIQDHDDAGEPLSILEPTLLTSHVSGRASKILAVSACQVVFESPEDGVKQVARKGFANIHDLEQEAQRRFHEASAWLGRDMFRAFTSSDGSLYTLDRTQPATQASCAAIDGHGRILAITDGQLRLFGSLSDLHNACYSEVGITGPPTDLSRASVYAGAAHFIVLAKSKTGSSRVYGIGDNRLFQQGHQKPTSWETATLVNFFDEGIAPVVKVACGDSHTAFLTEDGALYMSGSNNKGQCGGFSEQEPCLVTFDVEDGAECDIDFLDVACGSNHTVALTTRGVYVAGQNNAGQLGTSSVNDGIAFVRMALPLDTQERVISVHAAGWNTFIGVSKMP